MKIEQANSISLTELLDKLGIKPVRQSADEVQYFSPFRNEKTASFYVNTKKNSWCDHGTGEGGGPIQFGEAYLKSQGNDHVCADSLRLLDNVMGNNWSIITPQQQTIDNSPPKYIIRSKGPIKQISLLDYLKQRGISMDVAHEYLKQVRVTHRETNKPLTALGLKNEKGGWELFGPEGKRCVKPKGITFIRGTIPKPPGIHIFEGPMDFLSIIEQRHGVPLGNAAIVLNSVALRKQAEANMKGFGYKYAYSWMDNDKAGERTRADLDTFFQNEGIVHRPQNARYTGYKDVNEHHVAQIAKFKFLLGDA